VKAWINDGNTKFSNHFADVLRKMEMEENSCSLTTESGENTLSGIAFFSESQEKMFFQVQSNVQS